MLIAVDLVKGESSQKPNPIKKANHSGLPYVLIRLIDPALMTGGMDLIHASSDFSRVHQAYPKTG